jgi:hypothetical protein
MLALHDQGVLIVDIATRFGMEPSGVGYVIRKMIKERNDEKLSSA